MSFVLQLFLVCFLFSWNLYQFFLALSAVVISLNSSKISSLLAGLEALPFRGTPLPAEPPAPLFSGTEGPEPVPQPLRLESLFPSSRDFLFLILLCCFVQTYFKIASPKHLYGWTFWIFFRWAEIKTYVWGALGEGWRTGKTMRSNVLQSWDLSRFSCWKPNSFLIWKCVYSLTRIFLQHCSKRNTWVLRTLYALNALQLCS